VHILCIHVGNPPLHTSYYNSYMEYARFIHILIDEQSKNISYFVRFGGKLPFSNHLCLKNAFAVTKNKYLIDQEDQVQSKQE